MGDKGDKNAARPPEGSLVETRCLIKGPKSAIVPFPGPRSGPKSRTGPGALAKVDPANIYKESNVTRTRQGGLGLKWQVFIGQTEHEDFMHAETVWLSTVLVGVLSLQCRKSV